MELIGQTFFFPWEVNLMETLQAAIQGVALNVVSFFSAFGEETILILIMGFLFWSWDKRLGRRIGMSVLLGVIWNPMLKNVFIRRRPYMDHENIQILRVVEPSADPMDIAAQGYSFPSGHSTNAMALYGSLAANIRKRWMTVLAVLLPLLVGFSRVVVGAHYPTDVVVGWALGGVAIFASWLLEEKIHSIPLRFGVVLLLTLPGIFWCRSDDYFSSIGLMIGFMAGTLIDEKWVKFENTRCIPRMILRVFGGLAIYLVLNTLLKLPFDPDFLRSGTMPALLLRSGRYAVIALVMFGFYPMLFRLTARIGAKKAEDEEIPDGEGADKEDAHE